MVVHINIQTVSPLPTEAPEPMTPDAIRETIRVMYNPDPYADQETGVRILGSSFSSSKVQYIDRNTFFMAFMLAFTSHYRLVLSPCAVWQVILSGFTIHMRFTEAGKRIFNEEVVDNDEKPTLSVRRDDFIYEREDNPWEEVFEEFCEQIQGYIIHESFLDTVKSDFSTSGPTELAASHITLMGACENYFDYELITMCGIPQVTLLGTQEDWVRLRSKTEELLTKFMLPEDGAPWWRCLEPVLSEFVEVHNGREPNIDFWKKAFKKTEPRRSGESDKISGWFNIFFPYLERQGEYRTNVYMLPWNEGSADTGPSPEDFPSLLTETPVRWRYLGEIHKITFQAGTIGLRIGIPPPPDSTDPPILGVQPIVAWFVSEKSNANISDEPKNRTIHRSVYRDDNYDGY